MKKISKIFPIHPFHKKWEYILFLILGPFLVFTLTMAIYYGEFSYVIQDKLSIIRILGFIARIYITLLIILRLVYAEKKFKKINH